MDTDEPVTLVDLGKRYIDTQYKLIIKGVFESCDLGHLNYRAIINEPYQDILMDILKKKFPDSKIVCEPAKRHPGLSNIVFEDSPILYRVHIPKRHAITIDWGIVPPN